MRKAWELPGLLDSFSVHVSYCDDYRVVEKFEKRGSSGKTVDFVDDAKERDYYNYLKVMRPLRSSPSKRDELKKMAAEFERTDDVEAFIQKYDR